MLSLASSLTAIGLPTFARHLRTSKVSEVPHALGLLRHRTLAFVRQPSTSPCFPSSAGPAPAKPSTSPVRVDFYDSSTPGSATWRALQFQPSFALRYRYSWLTSATGCGSAQDAPSSNSSTVTYRAEGDLDHDGVLSLFERTDELTAGELKTTAPMVVQRKLE